MGFLQCPLIKDAEKFEYLLLFQQFGSLKISNFNMSNSDQRMSYRRIWIQFCIVVVYCFFFLESRIFIWFFSLWIFRIFGSVSGFFWIFRTLSGFFFIFGSVSGFFLGFSDPYPVYSQGSDLVNLNPDPNHCNGGWITFLWNGDERNQFWKSKLRSKHFLYSPSFNQQEFECEGDMIIYATTLNIIFWSCFHIKIRII